MRRAHRGLWTLLVIVPCIAAALAISALAQPTEQTYRFVGTDHPVDMWTAGADRWAYFGANGLGSSASMAEKARVTLAPMGFIEDVTQRPWYRFVKGREEVIVCDHSEYGVGRDGQGNPTVEHANISEGPKNYPIMLVKNGLGSHASPAVFRIKKALLGW